MGVSLRKPEEYKHQPQVLSPTDAADLMLGKKRFLILTGAGLSAASGIPTFRGENGFWKREYAGVGNP